MDVINTFISNLAPYLAWLETSLNLPLTFTVFSLLLIFSVLIPLNSKFKKYKTETENDLATLKGQLYVTSSSMLAMAERIKKVELKTHSMINKQVDIESRYPEVRTFSKANELIMGGATVEDLISDGLNRPEADLFTKLNKNKIKKSLG
jgi:hypothetical protein